MARSYHLVLRVDDPSGTGPSGAVGRERDVRAKSYEVHANGGLEFTHDSGQSTSYAPGTWLYVEPELQDDRG